MENNFLNFMISDDYKDFNFWFICSRQNKWKINRNKFEILLDYYSHKFNIIIDKEIITKLNTIFIENDIIEINKYNNFLCNIDYDSITTTSDDSYINEIQYNININYDNILHNSDNFDNFDNFDIILPKYNYSIRNLNGNIPYLVLKNNFDNNHEYEIENNSDFDYNYNEENFSEDSEIEEII
tara:strand:+ start:1553 stop:2101 length:549 start_codon:yes stop_codon:yes gene_type:complete